MSRLRRRPLNTSELISPQFWNLVGEVLNGAAAALQCLKDSLVSAGTVLRRIRRSFRAVVGDIKSSGGPLSCMVMAPLRRQRCYWKLVVSA